MKHVANDLLTVSLLLELLTVSVALMWRWPAARALRVWLTVLASTYALFAIPAVPLAAGGWFARGYSPFSAADAAGAQVVVLLGTGTRTIQGRDQQLGLLDPTGAARVLEAARVYRLLGDPWVISSGGYRRLDRQQSAAVMEVAPVQLGLKRNRILLESQSRTTRDEAVLIEPMLRRLGAERFVLVTTRTHMPRSISAFRARGLTPVPAVAPDPMEDAEWPTLLTPDTDGLLLTRALLHEVLGRVYYRSRGWI